MGFRENVKEELSFRSMLVKELAVSSGVTKSTIDSYLKENGSAPSAENAVLIARALGVSVEYLITGIESRREKAAGEPGSELRQLMRAMEPLTENERKLVLKTALFLAENFRENKPKHPFRPV
jgi:transcriptional regulator with XRE-family HTH domain